MPRRILNVDSERWEVSPSGRVSVYGRDQFGLIFEQGAGPQRRRRVTRFSPVGPRSPDRAFQELTERELLELFRQSQPAWTAPEADYAAH
ncbi:MAG TPA: hypothetical protein VL549_03995 [Gemmatimonadales bacterium]|jgi:hypothetical protein|nr:hypothetical protein [Gemmatimonadales bacterium]